MQTPGAVPQVNLPTRSIQIDPKAVARPKMGIFAVIVLLVIGLALTIWQGPGIWRDVQLKSDGVHTSAFRITKGDCTTRNLVFTSCDAQFDFITHDSEDVYQASADFMFLDWSSGDYAVDVVYDAEDPSKATLSLGLDKLWNRALTWGVLAIFFIGGGGFMIVLIVRTSRDRKALREPGLLSTTAVEIKQTANSRKSSFITYSHAIPGKKMKRNYFTHFAHGQEPLIMQGYDGKPFGLAVTHPGTTTPVLLDRGLTRVAISDAERAGIFAQLGA